MASDDHRSTYIIQNGLVKDSEVAKKVDYPHPGEIQLYLDGLHDTLLIVVTGY